MGLRLSSIHESTKRSLSSELESLEHKIKRAREALAKGEPLDEHLIQNAGGIAIYIARHNTCLELRPYLETP